MLLLDTEIALFLRAAWVAPNDCRSGEIAGRQQNQEKQDQEITACDRDWGLFGIGDTEGKSNEKQKDWELAATETIGLEPPRKILHDQK